MKLMFKLSMPNVGSWNGRWIGKGRFHARIETFTKKQKIVYKSILEKQYYHYNFGDGWSADIIVSEVDAKEARKIKKNSLGFCGYDWMVKSIINHREIIF